MNCQKDLYHFLIDAKDKEGCFYQNYYSCGLDINDAVDKTLKYLTQEGCFGLEIAEHELITIEDLPDEEMVKYEEFDGYIQNIKFIYDEED